METRTNLQPRPAPGRQDHEASGQGRNPAMRVGINLLTEDTRIPTGAHWFWTRIIPEIARRLEPAEELHLLVSPTSRRAHQDYGPNVHYITYPWSNERRTLRTL